MYSYLRPSGQLPQYAELSQAKSFGRLGHMLYCLAHGMMFRGWDFGIQGLAAAQSVSRSGVLGLGAGPEP